MRWILRVAMLLSGVAIGVPISGCSAPRAEDRPVLEASDFQPAPESVGAKPVPPPSGLLAVVSPRPASPAAVQEQPPAGQEQPAPRQPGAQEPSTGQKQEAEHEAPPEGGDEAALAKKLANPVADLISVPFQSNFDFNIGDENGWRYTMNFQPVVPVGITEDWNVIIRTIVPVIYQHDVVDDGGSAQFGLGDTTQSFFFSPKQPTSWGLIWGVGPAFLWPTATDDTLGSQKWGVGPTAVFLLQEGPCTYGFLGNQIWSYAGDDDRQNVSSTFLQPFFNYTTKTGFGISLNTESTYNWETNEWNAPIGLFFSQVVRLGRLPVQVEFGPRFYAATPDGEGPNLGFRLNITFLFPK